MEKINYNLHYPELSQEGKEKTQALVNAFKIQLEELVNNILYAFTCNIGNEIVDDDSWVDIRRQTMNAICGYNGTDHYNGVNWVQVRKKILEENREQIINDIIRDKENEVKHWQDAYYNLQNSR